MEATRRRPGPRIDASRRLDWDLFDRLTRARGANTIDEKAALVDVHRATIFRLKNGTQTPSEAMRSAMAEALGVKIDRLFPRAQQAA